MKIQDVHLGIDTVEHSLGVAQPCAGGVNKLVAHKRGNWVNSSLAAHSEALGAASQA